MLNVNQCDVNYCCSNEEVKSIQILFVHLLLETNSQQYRTNQHLHIENIDFAYSFTVVIILPMVSQTPKRRNVSCMFQSFRYHLYHLGSSLQPFI